MYWIHNSGGKHSRFSSMIRIRPDLDPRHRFTVSMLTSQQLFRLIVGQFLAQSGEQVTELSRADEPVTILQSINRTKKTKTLQSIYE